MYKKTLYLARHAKSSRDNPQLSDFTRPLNKRGQGDASMMAGILKSKGVSPQLILSSPALRARQTAEIYHDLIGGTLRFDERIYEASPTSLLYLVQETLQDHDSVMIVGHNPALTELNAILGDTPIYNLPTAAVVGLGFEEAIAPHRGKTLLYKYPKKHKR
jgi:phosphohistidine phosphatase